MNLDQALQRDPQELLSALWQEAERQTLRALIELPYTIHVRALAAEVAEAVPAAEERYKTRLAERDLALTAQAEAAETARQAEAAYNAAFQSGKSDAISETMAANLAARQAASTAQGGLALAQSKLREAERRLAQLGRIGAALATVRDPEPGPELAAIGAALLDHGRP